jgi:two-component system phosphate regulon sensor histidine kinase PhoR
MKTDFVNNMTHEFKTPIATISLASEMLLKPQINESPDKTSRYASIIFDENLRLKHQVEHVLNVAILDRGDFELKFREVNIHRILEDMIKNFNLILKERNGRIKACFHATSPVVPVDKVHFTNIINNLLDNANKYSPESPEISITTNNKEGGIVISVIDRGIGISHENLNNIFRRFYRIPTGNIHNIKGFGLGLFYVKTMVEAHDGTISVTSELNKGSRFDLFFPYMHSNHNKPENEDQETTTKDTAG